MNNDYPGMPKIMMPIVDVRETAQAHLLAIKKPEAANKRFILSNETIWFQRVAQVLNDHFSAQGYKLRTGELNYCSITIGALFIPELKLIKPMWGINQHFDNSQSREVLGLEYGDINKSLVEMVYSMFETGALQDKRVVSKVPKN
jgi:dihydroflavonol-4-reductase